MRILFAKVKPIEEWKENDIYKEKAETPTNHATCWPFLLGEPEKGIN